ncbi:uncharacterized protein LOC134686275 [Mytilus trossulus]|uniref:uncharacterized protein LOC134686275 n=1 Tax=Mytilus trossulus TaxID=6551 RepID=UPI003003D39D
MEEDGKEHTFKNKLVQASLKNVQKQRQLVMELNDIDKQMEVEMKILTRDKLDALKEYCRLEEDKRKVEYLTDDMNGEYLQRYNQNRRGKDEFIKDEKDYKEKFNFGFNTNKIYVKLPPLEFPEILKENKPPVPPKKPRLYRSNSLIRQRSASENSVLQPVQFSASLRRTKTPTHYMSLPDINKFDKSNKKMLPKKSMPDIDEKSESVQSIKISETNTVPLPQLGGRSRTIY